MKSLSPLEAEDQSKILFSPAVIEKSVVADLLEPGRKDMHHEPSHELLTGKHERLFLIVPVVFIREGHLRVGNRKDSGIGDGDAVGVPTEVLNGVSLSVEGLLDVDVPLFLIEAVAEGSPFIGVPEIQAGIGKRELSLRIKFLKSRKELAAEYGSHDLCREEKGRPLRHKLPVGRKPSAGNDAAGNKGLSGLQRRAGSVLPGR